MIGTHQSRRGGRRFRGMRYVERPAHTVRAERCELADIRREWLRFTFIVALEHNRLVKTRYLRALFPMWLI